jgi:4-amino-4-deoxy-L-arabinose transferase-like glycosyltransferase
VNQFTIRISTLIIFTASLYFLYLTGKKLFDDQSALLTLIIASIIPIFTIAFGVLTLPDVPLIFFWTLTLLCSSYEFFLHENLSNYQPSYRIALIGVSVGLACLGKYHGFILGLGLVGFCFFNPPYRRVFTSYWLLIAAGLFLLTLFPLLYWNWQHDWISFGFQLSGRFKSSNPSPLIINPLNIILVALVGVGYLFPTFGFPLWWVSFKSLWSEITIRHNYRYQLILWVSLPLTMGFTVLGAVTQILPTWAMPGFWSLTLILGDFAHQWLKYSEKLVKRWLYLSLLTINTILLLVLAHSHWGLFQKPSQNIFFSGLISPQNDPSTELIDIVQLRANLASSPFFTEALKSADFIFTNQYYLGGYIGMAIAPLTDIPLVCFSDDSRGFNYWYPLEKLKGKTGLYLTSKRFSQEGGKFSQYFENWREIAQIPLKRSGEITEVFYLYQGQNLKIIPKIS